MNINHLTLDAFLCAGACTITSASPGAFNMALPVVEDQLGDILRTLGQGLDLHHLLSGRGDVAISHGGKVIGFYFGDLLAVDPAHAGRKLSVPLVLAAIPHRGLPSERTLTPEGKAALERAWRVAHGQETNPWP